MKSQGTRKDLLKVEKLLQVKSISASLKAAARTPKHAT